MRLTQCSSGVNLDQAGEVRPAAVRRSSSSFPSPNMRFHRLSLLAITSPLILSASALPISRSIVCNRTTWHDIVIFFVANYIAHAATVPSVPGAKWYDSAFWTTVSLFLPLAGLGKSAGLVGRHFLAGKSDLEKASAREALLVVVRSRDWQPGGDPAEVYVKLSNHFSELDEKSTTLPSATILVNDNEFFHAVPKDGVSVHGGVVLPKGYHLAYPSFTKLPYIFPLGSLVNQNTTLSRSQSWSKMAISAGQLIYSLITLYRTQGGQLDRYGYAAFGLSMFPYAFMSLANLICVGLVGEYPSLYLLRTAIMDEARQRGGSFHRSSWEFRVRGSGTWNGCTRWNRCTGGCGYERWLCCGR
ncbi:hypothetical protein JAAARDRAFT_492802 [Jaapia argillacea MUCL 33604]|uniref:Uncharacterized protein n=1 Tax=Jaapia argillacea MUCL 33604 TaxID=933084 RepID=A0A067PB75_9AGAM|nr:hypothetical protein JAAARDRAFT_492802 [Jaapia argillacea MUCL 33604]